MRASPQSALVRLVCMLDGVVDDVRHVPVCHRVNGFTADARDSHAARRTLRCCDTSGCERPEASTRAVTPDSPSPMPLQDAVDQGEALLRDAAERTLRLVLLGSSISARQTDRGRHLQSL